MKQQRHDYAGIIRNLDDEYCSQRLMNVFDGDAVAMLSDIERRAAESEDYETAAQMRDLNTKLKKVTNE
mgnify:CR=1 FL=1